MHIPKLPAGEATKQTFSRDFGEPPVPSSAPPSGSEDDFIALAAPVPGQAMSADEQSALFARLLRVESPAHQSPNTLDCASCHISTPTTKLVVEPLLGLFAEDAPHAFEPSTHAFSASDLQPTFEDAEPTTNVHAFSYGETVLASASAPSTNPWWS